MRKRLGRSLFRLAGWQDDHTTASNFRRSLSRYVFLVVLVLSSELVFSQLIGSNEQTFIFGVALYVLSIVFFLVNIMAVPLLTDTSFRPHPLRLFKDTVLSGAASIVCSSVLYRSTGLTGGNTEANLAPLDYLYFSMVTFSTLGYGDLQPSADARLFAALQAIIGNLHMGMLIASLFFLVTRQNLEDG